MPNQLHRRGRKPPWIPNRAPTYHSLGKQQPIPSVRYVQSMVSATCNEREPFLAFTSGTPATTEGSHRRPTLPIPAALLDRRKLQNQPHFSLRRTIPPALRRTPARRPMELARRKHNARLSRDFRRTVFLSLFMPPKATHATNVLESTVAGDGFVAQPHDDKKKSRIDVHHESLVS